MDIHEVYSVWYEGERAVAVLRLVRPEGAEA